MDQEVPYEDEDLEYEDAATTNDPTFHPPNTSTPAPSQSPPNNRQKRTLNPPDGQTLVDPTSLEQLEPSTMPPRSKFTFHFTKNLNANHPDANKDPPVTNTAHA
jgi:hypothetical protein